MDCLSPSSPIERVVVIAGAQIGKTSCGLNWLGFIVQEAPGTILAVQPTLDMARRFSRQRLNPLFEESPALRGLLSAPYERTAAAKTNTMMIKEFVGGALILTGANAPTGLRSVPARYLFLDEIDAYPSDAGEEGDPIDLAMARMETYRKLRLAKVLMTSTPSLRGYSRIQQAFEETDQRYFFVPCAGCGDMAPITWARITWPEGRPEAAGCRCDVCGYLHTERDKPALLRAGKWRSTNPNGDPRSAGFHISGLYSPWADWGDIAVEHQQVHKDPTRLQVFINTRLGECWEDQAGDVCHPEPLMARCENWGEMLPDPIGVLTAGVDLQADRIEVQIVGWGNDEESWVIDYLQLWGEPTSPKVWRDLQVVLKGTYKHNTGIDMPISATAIDKGYSTKAAYDFCRTRLPDRIWAIKGQGGPGVPVWPKRAKKIPGKIPTFNVGVDAAKDAIFARLKLAEPGPGFIHFSKDRDIEYFRQLTSEKVVTTYSRGRPVRSWQPRFKGDRNEALDTFVYALAALHGLIASGFKINDSRTRLGMSHVHVAAEQPKYHWSYEETYGSPTSGEDERFGYR